MEELKKIRDKFYDPNYRELQKHLDWKKYWADRYEKGKHRSELTVRKKACKHCAAKCMYKDHSDSLKEQPEEIRDFHCKTWFCHDTPGLACRGNWDNVYGTKRRKKNPTSN